MCGEHHRQVEALACPTGSSPHVRGTHLQLERFGWEGGIIPACAGNTLNTRSRVRLRRDHPRMCGEHRQTGIIRQRRLGSSPHVRGTLSDLHGLLVAQGIIPACAGNTHSPARKTRPCGDHPRMCGEHRISSMTISRRPGSSPHVRGTQTRIRT